MAKSKLYEVRKAHGPGWSQEHVVRQLRRRAAARSLSIASAASLAIMLSRWENGHVQVTEPVYQQLFREVYGRTNEELGFPPAPVDESTAELRARLQRAGAVDITTIELFRRQVDDVRHLDRRLGAVPLLDQLNTTIEQVNELLRYSTKTAHRQALAAVLADAAMLAGWEALDRNSLSLAWHLHEVAKTAAQEAESTPFLAYATGQQAFVLIELGMFGEAVQLLEYAQDLGKRRTADLLCTWLAAAHGESLAAHGEAEAALRWFDKAARILPADTNDPDLPFLMLNAGHLIRWRGSALCRLNDRRAISALEGVLNGLNPTTVRARAGTLVDLAFAYATVGNRDGALEYARQARRLSAQIGSERQKRRLGRLLLPSVARDEI